MICKDCKNFIPNSGVTSHEVIYNYGKPSKLGNCKLTGNLKNELNSCSTMKDK